MSKTLRPAKAPNLLVGPVEYNKQYQDQLNNALRLYFTQLDNFTSAIMENDGGRYLNFPNVFLSEGTAQYAPADNTASLLQLNTVDINEGFVLTSTTIAPKWSGAYRIDYRLMLENSDAAAHSAWVWVKVNGTDSVHSCAKFSVPATGYVMASGFIELDLIGKDEIQLYWATDKAYSVAGPVNGVWMDAYPASTSPFSRPSIPSAYVSVTFVSELST